MAYEVEISLFRVKDPANRGMIEIILGSLDPETTPVIVDGDVVFGHSHLSSAIMHASRSIIRGNSRARAKGLEVIRWLTGSHQVSRSLEIANPGAGTHQIILIEMDRNWPIASTEGVLPQIIEKVRAKFSIDGLDAVTPPFKFGGRTALERLGMDAGPDKTMDEMEKMVLEKVALTDLK